jgi:hypothetical protein
VFEATKRLTVAVLGYFPDHADSFKSVSKATVSDIIHDVGFFLLENYRMVTDFIQEQDTVYEELDIYDSASRSSLGEVKFADFRIEMAIRLLKTSRLDLRLAGLIELKEVLVRIQRLQQTRSRMRRRSEVDMDLQVDHDRKPIEYLCTKLQGLQIVGYIFGPNIHLEIVQRSTDLLAFLVQAKVLTMADVDLIWAAVGVSYWMLEICSACDAKLLSSDLTLYLLVIKKIGQSTSLDCVWRVPSVGRSFHQVPAGSAEEPFRQATGSPIGKLGSAVS